MAKRTGSAPYSDPQKNKAPPQSNPTSATLKVGDDDKVIQVSESQNPLVNPLLNALWRSPDRHHQIGVMDRQTKQFKNIPVKGVASAVERALALSDAGMDVYFGCAEYVTPDSRLSSNASGAFAFWMDIDCGEDKAAAGKGYPTVDDAKAALDKFCKLAGLSEPTYFVFSGGGLHVYWVLDNAVSRDVWQAYARKLKSLTKACRFLADDSRTADIASVLRVPGTLNYKFSPPKTVFLQYASAQFIERSVILDAIDSAHNKLCGAPASQPVHLAKSAHLPASADQSKYGPPDIMKLASALVTLDPDCDEDTWKLRRLAPLAQAARTFPECCEDLYETAKSWSSGELRGSPSKAWFTPGNNGHTGKEIFDDVWHRFLHGEYGGLPVTLGTIYYDAKAAGWIQHIDPADQFEVVGAAVEGNA